MKNGTIAFSPDAILRLTKKCQFCRFLEPGGYPKTSRAPPGVEDAIFHRSGGVPGPVFERIWRHLGSPLGSVGVPVASLWRSGGRPETPKAVSGAFPGCAAICTATVAVPRVG